MFKLPIGTPVLFVILSMMELGEGKDPDVRKPIGCPTCNVDDKEEAMEARRKNL
jgi:hypothetical protein